MNWAGFVLAGGRSSRMGRNKALLPFRGRTLLDEVASSVRTAAGSVAIVGKPEIYQHMGFPVIPDLISESGPLGGIHAALSASEADWNLVVACDMPAVSAEILLQLMAASEESGADCLIPSGPSGRPEPLCAAYHRRSLPAIAIALDNEIRKVMDALKDLHVRIWPVTNAGWFQNLNTPQEWVSYRNA